MLFHTPLRATDSRSGTSGTPPPRVSLYSRKGTRDAKRRDCRKGGGGGRKMSVFYAVESSIVLGIVTQSSLYHVISVTSYPRYLGSDLNSVSCGWTAARANSARRLSHASRVLNAYGGAQTARAQSP